ANRRSSSRSHPGARSSTSRITEASVTITAYRARGGRPRRSARVRAAARPVAAAREARRAATAPQRARARAAGNRTTSFRLGQRERAVAYGDCPVRYESESSLTCNEHVFMLRTCQESEERPRDDLLFGQPVQRR